MVHVLTVALLHAAFTDQRAPSLVAHDDAILMHPIVAMVHRVYLRRRAMGAWVAHLSTGSKRYFTGR